MESMERDICGSLVDLSGVNLCRINLRGVNHIEVYLRGADLREVDANQTKFGFANISKAKL